MKRLLRALALIGIALAFLFPAAMGAAMIWTGDGFLSAGFPR